MSREDESSKSMPEEDAPRSNHDGSQIPLLQAMNPDMPWRAAASVSIRAQSHDALARKISENEVRRAPSSAVERDLSAGNWLQSSFAHRLWTGSFVAVGQPLHDRARNQNCASRRFTHGDWDS